MLDEMNHWLASSKTGTIQSTVKEGRCTHPFAGGPAADTAPQCRSAIRAYHVAPRVNLTYVAQVQL